MISDYLADCLDRQGKSGYGLAPRTYEAYEYRLGFLAELKPEAFIDEIDDKFLRVFRRFLLQHKKDLSDRTCYNIMQAVSTIIRPGRPVENGFVETFNGRLRDECLDVEWFGSLYEGQERLAQSCMVQARRLYRASGFQNKH